MVVVLSIIRVKTVEFLLYLKTIDIRLTSHLFLEKAQDVAVAEVNL